MKLLCSYTRDQVQRAALHVKLVVTFLSMISTSNIFTLNHVVFSGTSIEYGGNQWIKTLSGSADRFTLGSMTRPKDPIK